MKKLSCKELRGYSAEQMTQKVDELRRKLLELRLNAVSAHDASFASKKLALRRSIARALTLQKQQEMRRG